MSGPTEKAQRRARRLRREPTRAEQVFWGLVRDRRLDGLKFRRQAPFGPYVADFLCAGARLIVELDGGVHKLRVEEDAARDAFVRAEGWRVLRFGNEQVESRPHEVVAAVRAALGKPQAAYLR